MIRPLMLKPLPHMRLHMSKKPPRMLGIIARPHDIANERQIDDQDILKALHVTAPLPAAAVTASPA